MSTKPCSHLFMQAADLSGYYVEPIKPGTTLDLQADQLVVTRADGKPARYPRATPDTAQPVIMIQLFATAEAETVGPDGIGVWTAMAGSTVSTRQVRVQWQGQPGDTPPTVEGMDGLFTEANRVDGP